MQHCNSATARGSLTFIKRAPAIDFMAAPRAGWGVGVAPLKAFTGSSVGLGRASCWPGLALATN